MKFPKNTILHLNSLELKTFTEQDAVDYCFLNNTNSDNIIELNLNENKLTDISGIKLFKNLEILYLWNNYITDISVIKNLTNLEYLNISDLELESDQIQYINSLKKLNFLMCYNGFKDKSVINKLNKNIKQY